MSSGLTFSPEVLSDINNRAEAAEVYRAPRPDWGWGDVYGHVVFRPTFRERLLLLLGAPCFFRWRITMQHPPGAMQIGSEVNMLAVLKESVDGADESTHAFYRGPL